MILPESSHISIISTLIQNLGCAGNHSTRNRESFIWIRFVFMKLCGKGPRPLLLEDLLISGTCVLEEKASHQIMKTHVENDPNPELEPKISYVKGSPGNLGRGTPTGHSGAPLSPGGERFAQLGALLLEEERSAKHSL